MLLSAMGIAAAQQRRRAGAAKVNRLMMYLLLINVPRKVEQRPGKASRGSAACSRSACKPSPAPSSRDAHSDLSALPLFEEAGYWGERAAVEVALALPKKTF